PQRHRATVRRGLWMISPSSPTISTAPRTRSGPSAHAVICGACSAIDRDSFAQRALARFERGQNLLTGTAVHHQTGSGTEEDVGDEFWSIFTEGAGEIARRDLLVHGIRFDVLVEVL